MKIGSLYRVVSKHGADGRAVWETDMLELDDPAETVSRLCRGDHFVFLGKGRNGFDEILVSKDGQRGFFHTLNELLLEGVVVKVEIEE
jgi:hypothetical protein